MNDQQQNVEVSQAWFATYTDIETSSLADLYIGGLFEALEANKWVDHPVDTVSELRKFLATGYVVFSDLRSSFDGTLWVQQDKGKYVTIESIRARSDFKNGKPGRKAKGLADKLAEKLG